MPEPIDTDVAIVGGGPAGLAAAIALRRRGIARVLVLERESEAGGIPRHCGHPPFGIREFGRPMTGPRYARRLRAEAAAAGVDLRTGHSVVSLEPGGRLTVAAPEGVRTVAARRIILATGAREATRAARLASGDRPIGVINTGALQSYIYLKRLKPFRRPVVVGTELVGLSALWTCMRHGIRPVAVVEEGMRATARWPLSLFPRLLGIPVHYGSRLGDIAGLPRVTHVEIDGPGGRKSRLACDGVLFTGRFLPEAALVRMGTLALDRGSGGPAVDQHGRCSDPAYFAAGNLLRPIETAGWCFREGRRIGEAVADDLAGALPVATRTVRVGHAAPIRFAVPQSLSLAGSSRLTGTIQLRVGTESAGRLTVRAGGRLLWSRRIDTRPERRILVPLQGIDLPEGIDAIEIAIEPGGGA
ncbi:FAD-dependent oxidoreductase [Labrys monachus]|uniref:NADPH-dependent 2,4-dienoyl-CoA reductase/sulfur reductase-like enzyme n=1 Tax=Labrys monachus TaxID=217067 RepID=A0ABU0FC89_9HYPH|nr:FAD-dependent oxidoreductase [Labrys monachus]MDQ0391937.1 NADPH-dependent 2,4-dienoyl-CoA reductase/sulfur reductase-like enzyme [Labrys monachus]